MVGATVGVKVCGKVGGNVDALVGAGVEARVDTTMGSGAVVGLDNAEVGTTNVESAASSVSAEP